MTLILLNPLVPIGRSEPSDLLRGVCYPSLRVWKLDGRSSSHYRTAALSVYIIEYVLFRAWVICENIRNRNVECSYELFITILSHSTRKVLTVIVIPSTWMRFIFPLLALQINNSWGLSGTCDFCWSGRNRDFKLPRDVPWEQVSFNQCVKLDMEAWFEARVQLGSYKMGQRSFPPFRATLLAPWHRRTTDDFPFSAVPL